MLAQTADIFVTKAPQSELDAIKNKIDKAGRGCVLRECYPKRASSEHGLPTCRARSSQGDVRPGLR